METSIQQFEEMKRAVRAARRISRRDPDDCQVVAAALALDCPIRTEDLDFFGCGVATWTTDTVGIFLDNETERDTLTPPTSSL